MSALSIVIPTLDEGGQITACLQSLRSCCPNDAEIIVVDGGSTDNTVVCAKQLADKVISSSKGRAAQMNAGAQQASGEYFLFLHADTQLPKNFQFLWQQWHEQSVRWGYFSVRLSGTHWLLRWVEKLMNWRSRLTGIGTGDQCLFVRRGLFQQQGGFPQQPLMEDIELCKKLKKVCRPSWQASPVITSSRRWEQRGIIKTILQMWRIRWAYFFGVSAETLAKHYYSENSYSKSSDPKSCPPNKYQFPNSCIVQFAKVPRRGRVKTRLQGALGEEGSLSLHKALLEHQLQQQQLAAVAPLEIWACSEGGESYFQSLIESSVTLAVQQGDDLGERMANCFADRLQHYDNVILIGSDCPAIDGDYIAAAITALEQGVPAVFGPAEDGGYVLVGLSRLDQQLFGDILWGSDQVMAATRQKLTTLGWQWQELPSLQDIDRADDLPLLKQFSDLARFAP